MKSSFDSAVTDVIDQDAGFTVSWPATRAARAVDWIAAPNSAGWLAVVRTLAGSRSSFALPRCSFNTPHAALPFGGPFKTWAQFHAFCDHLARTAILSDDRFPEEHCRRQGSQALADVLKANFNPNFTPNEINPDRNLYLMVDKTDLIVNSTEFCFLPTGYFQVNALGRIGTAETSSALEGVALTRRSLLRRQGYATGQRLAAVEALGLSESPAARGTLERLAREAEGVVRYAADRVLQAERQRAG